MDRDPTSPGPAPSGRANPERPAIPDLDLMRPIGSGAYGEVWLARDVTGNYRAVKVVYRSHFPDQKPYDREFDGIRRFTSIYPPSASQLKVLHAGRNEGFLYYIMELADPVEPDTPDSRAATAETVPGHPQVDGRPTINPATYVPKTLRRLLQPPVHGSRGGSGGRRPLPASQCLEIGIALASALAHLHQHRLVHRDIKPSNILFVDGLPKLGDIGLVAASGEPSSLVGTAGYLPPEGPGDPQADLYALGKVLYEMATGLDPHDYPGLPDHWATAPERSEFHELNQVVLKACEQDRRRRYASAEEMRADLELLRSRKSLLHQRRLERSLRWLGRVVAASTTALGLALLAVWFYRDQAGEQARLRELTEVERARNAPRKSGWIDQNWARLERAAAIRMDPEVEMQATALMAAMDARCITNSVGTAASSAAFGPDGQALVSGIDPNEPCFIVGTNGVMTALSARGPGVVGWTSDGVPLHLSGTGGGAQLRNANTGTIRSELTIPSQGANRLTVPQLLAMTPGGGIVVAAAHERVWIWRTDEARLIGEKTISATGLALSPDGSLLGVGGPDGTAYVYALPDLTEVARLPSPWGQSPIQSLAFGRDRLVRTNSTDASTNPWLLATGDQGAGIVVWELGRRLPRSFCRGSTWTVLALQFHPDGMTLASAGRNPARLWDVNTGEPLLSLDEPSDGESRALAIDRTGSRLIYGGEPGAGMAKLGLWELAPDRGIQPLRGLTAAARKVWVSADSTRVAALSDDWHLAVWDLKGATLLWVFETAVGRLADTAGGCFSPTSSEFAFAAGTNACRYDLSTGAIRQRWDWANLVPDRLQYDPAGRLLLLGREPDRERRMDRWVLCELGPDAHPQTVHRQQDTNWSALDLMFTPDGRRFLVSNGGPDGTPRILRVYETATGKERWQTNTGSTTAYVRLAVDPSSRWFGWATASNKRLRIFDSSSFKELEVDAGENHAISPSGREFAGFITDAWIDSSLGPTPQRLFLRTDWRALTWVGAFSRDGQRLAWGTEPGIVMVANLPEIRQQLARLRSPTWFQSP